LLACTGALASTKGAEVIDAARMAEEEFGLIIADILDNCAGKLAVWDGSGWINCRHDRSSY
jgi:hypothetical protein